MSEASSAALPGAPSPAALPAGVLRSPFEGHAAFERPARDGSIGIRLSATTLRSVLQIHTWTTGIDALAPALSAALATPLPARTGELVQLPFGVLLRTGPQEFLLVGDGSGPDLRTLRQAISSSLGSVTDLSQARCLIHLEGPRSRDLLSKLFALDLRAPAFPIGQARLTGHHHVGCTLVRWGEDAFDMFVFSTYAHDQLATVIDAGLEYGVALEDAPAG